MEAETGAPTFWGSSERAQKHIAKLNGLKRAIAGVVAFHRKLDDAAVMVELIETATGAEKDQYGRELDQTVEVLVAELDQLELASFLSGQFDRNNAILSIQAGAGGTESCDWTDMLFRMYNRWAERRGFSLEVQDVQAGDQAGITKATLVIKGENAYGYVKAERGVHRLVRISPFDAKPAPLGPAVVHSEEHVGPIAGLRATRPRLDREDRVVAVELAAEKAGELELIQLRDENLDRLIKFTAILILLCAGGGSDEFHHHRRVVQLPMEGHHSGDRPLQTIEFGDVLLGALAVVPKLRSAHLGLHGLDLVLLLLDVKETSIDGRRAS